MTIFNMKPPYVIDRSLPFVKRVFWKVISSPLGQGFSIFVGALLVSMIFVSFLPQVSEAEIKRAYQEVLHRDADKKAIDYYKDKIMSYDNLKGELLQTKGKKPLESQ